MSKIILSIFTFFKPLVDLLIILASLPLYTADISSRKDTVVGSCMLVSCVTFRGSVTYIGGVELSEIIYIKHP